METKILSYIADIAKFLGVLGPATKVLANWIRSKSGNSFLANKRSFGLALLVFGCILSSVSIALHLLKYEGSLVWILATGLIWSVFGTWILASNFSRDLRKSVCLLVPADTGSDSDRSTDLRLIFDGIGDALSRHENPDAFVAVDIRFYGNAHKADETATIPIVERVRKELENGTRHFICTESEASKTLIESFEKLQATTPAPKPVLVCTVASQPSLIPSTLQCVYRFFPCADREAVMLASEALGIFSKTGVRCGAIYVNRLYANKLEQAFENKIKDPLLQFHSPIWSGSCELSTEDLSTLKTKLRLLGREIKQSDVIFIGGSWKVIKEILLHVDGFGERVKDILFVLPSAFDPGDRNSKRSDANFVSGCSSSSIYANRLNILTCRPHTDAHGRDLVIGSIVRFFVANSLLKMVDVIKTDTDGFDASWRSKLRPKGSDWNDRIWHGGNSDIPMRIWLGARAAVRFAAEKHRLLAYCVGQEPEEYDSLTSDARTHIKTCKPYGFFVKPDGQAIILAVPTPDRASATSAPLQSLVEIDVCDVFNFEIAKESFTVDLKLCSQTQDKLRALERKFGGEGFLAVPP